MVRRKVLQPAYRRGNSYQSVYAKLASPDSFQELKDSLTSNPQLTVSAMRAADYYGSQTETLQTIIRTIGGIIAVLMGVGAVFGAVITMYTAVASRTREIATLRALGFGSFPVVISVLVEAALLARRRRRASAARVAWLAFNGYETATMNFQSFSQIAFKFAVTPKLLGQALFYALLMGLVGRPAARDSRRASARRHGAARALDRAYQYPTTHGRTPYVLYAVWACGLSSHRAKLRLNQLAKRLISRRRSRNERAGTVRVLLLIGAVPMRIDDVLQRIRGEFLEMPGLQVTRAQAPRLWGLDRPVCDELLDVLVSTKFLSQTRDGSFVRSTA